MYNMNQQVQPTSSTNKFNQQVQPTQWFPSLFFYIYVTIETPVILGVDRFG